MPQIGGPAPDWAVRQGQTIRRRQLRPYGSAKCSRTRTRRSWIQYPGQRENTLGSANAGPRIGPVVINEVLYHPAPGGDEFVELKNTTGSPVKLYDTNGNPWRINGIDLYFPPTAEIPANGLLL